MKILITGTAGFIGYHLVKKLKDSDMEIVGVDNINDYYDVELKFARLKDTGIEREKISYNKRTASRNQKNYSFLKLDLSDEDKIRNLFKEQSFDMICNLAAQAGVRYSLKNPYAYINSNINGFLNILEGARNSNVSHFVYASSSSVYGLNKKMPFKTTDNIDHPVSLYAATKKSDELIAHSYSYLYGIPSTGLRFFTVYGPWGRPDMALFKFTKNIIEGIPIDVYNFGRMSRDFTYIDDIVEGIVRVLNNPPKSDSLWDGANPDPSSSTAPYKIYNIGNGNPVGLSGFIDVIEEALGKKADRRLLPIQPGDVSETWADTSDLKRDTDYTPKTPVEEGVKKFIEWYKKFYGK